MTAETPKQQKYWGETTNPESHNPDNFRYLVHGFNLVARDQFRILDAKTMIADKYKDDDCMEYGDQTIHLIDNPARLNERVSLSMSLIDQDHIATWGDGGLIVEADSQNIIATSGQDIGADNSSVSKLRKTALENPVFDGDVLLASTSPAIYNEVVAIAGSHPEMPDLRLAGLFYRATHDGMPIDSALRKVLLDQALKLGLPLVPILEEQRFADNKISMEGGELERIAVHLGGLRFLLKGFEDRLQFTVVQDGVRLRFMSPEQLQAVVSFMKSDSADEKLIEEAISNYELADRERQKIDVAFDETSGEFKSITRRRGHGTNEERVWLGSSGYSAVANLDNEFAKFKEMDLQAPGSMMKERESAPMLLTPEEARLFFEEALSLVDEGQRAVMKTWYEDNISQIENHWQHDQDRRPRSNGLL